MEKEKFYPPYLEYPRVATKYSQYYITSQE